MANPSLNFRHSGRSKSWLRLKHGHLLIESAYNPVEGRVENKFEYIDDKGTLIRYKREKDSKMESFRVYTLPEIISLIKRSGLEFQAAYGSLEIPLEEYGLDTEKMIIVGKKP